jgi:glyoxylase-like metal-dependent hydrolase (beta-lactamase superfamily II)
VALAEATGAELVGLKAPDAMGQDHSFVPSGLWQDGEVIELDGFSIELIATPGHVSNHICYLLREEKLLFTGDHILQGTTPVILPPDGDMADYLHSLEILLQRDLRFLPEHLIPWAKKTLLAHLYKLGKEKLAQESGETWSLLR